MWLHRHYRGYLDRWRARHDAVLQRLAEAIPGRDAKEIRVEQVPPFLEDYFSSGGPPPLSRVSENYTIVDVAISFENRFGALLTARRLKEEKYAGICQQLADTLWFLVTLNVACAQRANDKIGPRS